MQTSFSRYTRSIGLLLAAGLIAGISACRKEIAQQQHYDSDTSRQLIDGVKLRKKRVLLIGIDGAPGKLIKSMQPPVIMSLTPQSVVTWEGLTDTVSTPAAGWTTMATGVAYQQHQIGDSTLIPKSVEGSHAEIKYYNSFIYYLKEDDFNTKVTAVTPWEDLTNFVLNNADKVIPTRQSDGDKGVTDAVLKELSSANPDVLIANYNSPAIAGLQAGFSDNAVYRAAVTSVDTQIGKLLEGLKARKAAAGEDWLVIIQSTSGGVASKMGGRTGEERNSFTVMYSPVITPNALIGAPLAGKCVRLFGDAPNYVRAVNNDGGLYNPDNRSITIEAKVRFNKGPKGNYQFSWPPFLTKCASRYGSTVGWSMFRSGDKIVLFIADGSQKIEVTSSAINDGNFHAVTATIAYSSDPANGNTYTGSIYIDGVTKASDKLVRAARISSPSPLTLGYNPTNFQDAIDMYIADVRIWNTALPEDVVMAYTNRSDIDAGHPNYKNLIGYWPCMEGSGNQFKDLSASGKDFTVEGNYTWDLIQEPLSSKLAAPSLKDVTPSILGWMGLTLSGSSKPPGINWIVVKGVK
ncbi:LamG-like jellyroll fold domain-containing protein [Chitinophaga solisilvae]|uniref:LamG-like jellyroll fold domain-containing protein n=1 Tax=Chitinophaga solisilvae TaxID=1233460 RepID=UPI00136D8829|nr:LamG-like jellyroll fold domain-containing protein [Chitinophaga solisilvae]